MHIYRWDLDKTYLETDIHSVRSMIRTAFESARDKRNVPGSGALMRALLRVDPAARVAIVSGSPEQLRAVLEEKLALDGVRFDTLVLKDHLGNLRRGRLKAVYGQLGYKLPQILEQRVGLGGAVRETCFGDDTEVDALVYALVGEAVAGRVSERQLARVLEAGGAYPDAIERAVHALRRIGRAEILEDAFIHVDRGLPLKQFRLLGPRVIPVFSWFQAAVVLWDRGRLDAAGVVAVAREVTASEHMDGAALTSLLQDLTRRGRIGADRVAAMLDAAPSLDALCEGARAAVARVAAVPAPEYASPPDFLGFLAGLRA